MAQRGVPGPSSSSAAGASSSPNMPPAAAPAAAASASAAAAAPGAWLQAQLAQARQGLARLGAEAQAAGKAWRPPDLSKGLGVRLDVDVFSPALSTVRAQYEALPEPVREVLPYAGVSLATGLAVGRVYREQLQQAHQRYGHLRSDYEQTQAHMGQLEAQLSEAHSKRTGAHFELQMAEAVARATTAAATAATAAASAAAAAAAAASAAAPWHPSADRAAEVAGQPQGRGASLSGTSRLCAGAGSCDAGQLPWSDDGEGAARRSTASVPSDVERGAADADVAPRKRRFPPFS